MIVGLFSELLAAGGVQRAGRDTAAVLASYAEELGTQFEFLSLNDSPGLLYGQVGETQFPFRGFGRNKRRFIAAVTRLAWRSPRLVLAGHPNLAPLASTFQLLSSKTRVVVAAHGIEVWQPLPWLRRQALRRADRVLAPSRDTARKLVTSQHVPPEKIRLVPWGLDPEFIRASQIGSNHRPAQFPRGRVVLTVARLAANERYKGVDRLIETLPRLLSCVPDLHLVVVGDGNDRPRMEQQARELGLSERVVFLGALAGEDLIACYRDCDVFAMPSCGEGFGLVFLEAMALGKPVVAGAHAGALDIIEDGVTGFLVSHEDLQQLKATLERLLQDDALRETLGGRARERVFERHTFDQFRKRLLESVSEACAS
jgi:glycosyltransferase involved in cell wall biosynthesis